MTSPLGSLVIRIIAIPTFMLMGLMLGCIVAFGGHDRYVYVRRALHRVADNLEGYV